MRKSLRWAAAATAVAGAASLLMPVEPSGEASPVPLVAAVSRSTGTELVQIPAVLPAQVIEKTDKDPFRGVQKAVPPPSLPPSVPLVLPPAEPPKPPAFSYRYLGQFTEPGGKRTVYLAKGDRETAVTVGSQLEDGYAVEAIQATALTVVHAATQTRIDVPLPSAAASKP